MSDPEYDMRDVEDDAIGEIKRPFIERIKALENELESIRTTAIAEAKHCDSLQRELLSATAVFNRLTAENAELRRQLDGVGLDRMEAAQHRDELSMLKGELAACEDCHEKLEAENAELRKEVGSIRYLLVTIRAQQMEDYNRAEKAEKERDEARRKLEVARANLTNLVASLCRVHDSPEYQSVWMINQLHAGPYTGPNYISALDDAKEALQEISE